MSLPRQAEMCVRDLVADTGWRYDDPATLEKLATSLRRHGQVRPVIVRTAPDGTERVVDGRRLMAAMRTLGWERCMVAHVGALDDESATRMALDLELRAETDYARLALAVAELLDAGVPPSSLAAASPFTEGRIRHFGTLARFDWSQFSAEAAGQSRMDWDAPEAAAIGEAVGASVGSDRRPAEPGMPAATPATRAEAASEPAGPPGAAAEALDTEPEGRAPAQAGLQDEGWLF